MKKIFSIRLKLDLLFSVCTIALVVVLSFMVSYTVSTQSENDFYTNAKSQLEHIANGVQIFFNETQNTLEMLALNADVRSTDDTLHSYVDATVPLRVDSVEKSPTEQTLVALFKNVAAAFPEYVEVYVGTKWGGYATCFDGEMAAGYDPRKRGWYQLASSGNGKSMITDAFASTVGAVVVGLTKSFYDFNNDFIGNVSIEVTLTTLTDIIANSKIGINGYVILVQEDGTILADPRHPEFNFTNMADCGIAGFADLLKFEDKGADIFMDGASWASEVYSIGSPKWKLIAFQEKSEMMNNAFAIVRMICIVGLLLILVTGVVVFLFCKVLLRPLSPINDALALLEQGDFSKGIDVTSNDEFSLLAKSFNSFIEKIQKTIHTLKESESRLEDSRLKMNAGTSNTVAAIEEINSDIDTFNDTIKRQTESVQQTAGAMNEISANIKSLDLMISSQTSAVSDASGAVEELISNIKTVNGTVGKLSDSFVALEQKSAEGVEKHKRMNEKITQIKEGSAMLAEANKVISSIASQTNLLAMNAAIEAAHAGEAGQGFSVVADEIRKLSENSSVQSKTISKELSEIQKSIEEVVNSSAEVGVAFNGVSEKINNTNALVREISTAMQGQESGSRQISASLLMLNNSSEEVRTASREMNEGTKTILGEVDVLQDTTIDMDSGMSMLDERSVEMKNTQGELSALSKEMDEAIGRMRTSLESFKV